MFTFLPQTHFYLKRFEVIRNTGLDFSSHSLTSPLLESAELFVDVHDEDNYVL